MSLFDGADDASTPLTAEEREGLIPAYIALRRELNEAEQNARLAADMLVASLGQPRFTWGRVNLVEARATRDAYIAALRAADEHDIGPLVILARS